MMMVGNATYFYFLIHNPLQMIIIRFFPKINFVLNVVIALGVVLILSFAVGYLYCYIFVKKGITFVKLN